MFHTEATIYFGEKTEELRHGWGISTNMWSPGLCVYMKQMGKTKNKTKKNPPDHRL